MASQPSHKRADLPDPSYPKHIYLRLPNDFITVDAVPRISSIDGPDGPHPRAWTSFPAPPYQYSTHGDLPHYHHHDEPPSRMARFKQRWKTSATRLRHALTVSHKQSPVVTCFAYTLMLLGFVLWIVSLFRLVWT